MAAAAAGGITGCMAAAAAAAGVGNVAAAGRAVASGGGDGGAAGGLAGRLPCYAAFGEAVGGVGRRAGRRGCAAAEGVQAGARQPGRGAVQAVLQSSQIQGVRTPGGPGPVQASPQPQVLCCAAWGWARARGRPSPIGGVLELGRGAAESRDCPSKHTCAAPSSAASPGPLWPHLQAIAALWRLVRIGRPLQVRWTAVAACPARPDA